MQQQNERVDTAALEALEKMDMSGLNQTLRTPGAPTPVITPAIRLDRLIGSSKNTLAEMRVLNDKLLLEFEKQCLSVEHEFQRARQELDVAKQDKLDAVEKEYLKACKPIQDLIELCSSIVEK